MMRPSGWTFANGDHVAAGATVALPTYAIQRDELMYDDANKFHGFRFVEGNQKVNASERESFLAFGYGRHSWYVPCL
jgi:cytochrome P450